MRKTISLLLIISLLLSAIPVGAASFSDMDENDFRIAVTQLSNLGVLKGYEDGSFRPDEVMTRGEFAVLMAKLFGAAEQQLTNSYFYDIPEEHFAKNSIVYCAQMNLMQGYGDGTFRPDQPITYSESVKIMVCALGYYTLAENKGGYPVGYLEQARDLSILKGISKNLTDRILRGEIAQLAYNALNVQLLEETTFGVHIGLETQGNTILTKYMKMDLVRGIVQSNGYTKIEFVADVGEERIIVGDKTLIKDGNYREELLGMSTEAIYTTEDDRLVSIVALEDDNHLLTLNGGKLQSVEEGKLVYTEGEKDRKISVNMTRKVVHNGSFKFDYELSRLLELKDGYIRLIDNDGDNVYDVIFVYEYETFIVLDQAPSSKIIRDRKHGDKILDLEQYDYVVFRDTDGMLLDYDSIGRISILSVVRSEDYVECIVSNSTSNGEISEIVAGEDGDYYYIGSQALHLSDSFANSSENTLSVGDYVTVYLDALGNIAYAEKSAADMYQQAVLMGLQFEGGLEQTLRLKMFLRNDQVTVMQAAEHLYVDGIKYTTGSEAGAITDALTYRNAQGVADRGVSQFVLYRTDEAGNIREIYTAANDFSGDAKFYHLIPSAAQYYSTATYTFGGVANVDANTWLIKLPSGDLSDKTSNDFQIFSRTDFVSAQYQIEFYITSKNQQIADIVCIVGTTLPPSVSYESALATIVDVVSAVDGDGDVRTKIKYYSEGSMQEGFVAESYTGAEVPKKGEIVRFGFDRYGDINFADRYFDINSDQWIFGTSHQNTSASNHYVATATVTAAYVTYFRDGYIRLGFAKEMVSEQEAQLQQSYSIASGFTVYVVTQTGDSFHVRRGDINDVELLDRVVLRTRSGAGREIYVIKQ